MRFGTDISAQGFDAAANYQMVPVGGRRSFFCVTGEGAAIGIGPGPSLRFRTNAQSPVVLDQFSPFAERKIFSGGSIRLPPQTTCKFELFGARSGLVLIDYVDARGAVTETLTVSVKRPFSRKFILAPLKDTKRKSNRSLTSAFQAMERVNQLYENQTNTTWDHAGTTTVDMLYDLKDPLDPNQRRKGRRGAPGVGKTHAVNIRDRGKELGINPFSVFSVIYLAWNLRDGANDLNGENIVFAAGFSLTFVEDAAEPSTFAHELGHACSLDHENNSGTANLMHSPFTPNRFLFNREQIDIINATGLTPV